MLFFDFFFATNLLFISLGFNNASQTIMGLLLLPTTPNHLFRPLYCQFSTTTTRFQPLLPVFNPYRWFSTATTTYHDRHRTISSMSSSSTHSINMLSTFANLPVMTRPSTPQRVTYFPAPDRSANLEAIHALLPAPYINPHLTVLSHRTPLRESYERVIRDKEGR